MPAAWAAGRDEGLPKRNLIVAWRMVDADQTPTRNVAVRPGQMILDSRGGVVGRTGIGTETYETEAPSVTVQQLQVLNGSRAKLYVGRSQPYTVWQWAWSGNSTPAGQAGTGTGTGTGTSTGTSTGTTTAASTGTGAGASTPSSKASGAGYPGAVLPQTVWIDIGQGLTVRPRWPGGRAPVTVELEAQSRQPASSGGMGGSYGGQIEPDGQTRHIEAGSTLSVPMGVWTVVARSGAQPQRHQPGSLSTRDLDEGPSEQLEIRVTLP